MSVRGSLLQRDLAARMSELRSRAKLLFDNLLKPIAFPAAGGMLASLFCFVAIVDTLHYHPEWQPDMPVGPVHTSDGERSLAFFGGRVG